MDHLSQTLENESIEGEDVSPENVRYGVPNTPAVCDVCYELKMDTALLPCGHARICARCAQERDYQHR